MRWAVENLGYGGCIGPQRTWATENDLGHGEHFGLQRTCAMENLSFRECIGLQGTYCSFERERVVLHGTGPIEGERVVP